MLSARCLHLSKRTESKTNHIGAWSLFARHPSARARPARQHIAIGMTAATEAAREMALAELLGEVDRDGANVARVARDGGAHSGPLDLDLGDLDNATGAGDADEEAFARLLGVGVGDAEGTLDVELVKYADHDVVRNVMKSEASEDLKAKAKEVTAKLRAVELESIQDYVAESENLSQLHAQIEGCDEVLGSMEKLLSGFKDHLGKIGGEIKSLQEQSVEMSVKLSNRKLANALLGDFAHQITLPPDLIRAVCEDEVDEAYLKHLVRLDKRLRFLKTDPNAAASAAARDVAPELARLRAKAALKARDFLMQKLYSLRRPKTNVQIIQQNVLLKYKYLVAFLRAHAPEILVEIRACYVETMSGLLKQALQGHVRSLAELQRSAPRELLVPDDSYDAATSATAASAATASSPFALGARADVLDALETSPPVVTHQAQSSGQKLPHEKLFRSSHKLLMDTATFEFLFCEEFFGKEGDAATAFSDIFGPAAAVMNEQMLAGGSSSVAHDLLRGGNHDVVGQVLMLRVNAEHQCIMRRRGVPCLDRHLHGVELSLWPKCKAAFDAHLTSATRAAADPAKVARLWTDDTSAHPVAGRFADLAASMLAATGDALAYFGQIEKDVERLRDAVAALLLRIAEKFADARRRAAFLVNCCDRVCAVLAEARVIGPLDGALAAVGGESLAGCPTHRAFEAQAEAHADAYAEATLAAHFGALVAFARDAEAAGSGLDLETASSVVDDFGARWRAVVDAMKAETRSAFGGSARGEDALRRAASTLETTYARVAGPEGALARAGEAAAEIRARAVPCTTLAREVQQMCSNE